MTATEDVTTDTGVVPTYTEMTPLHIQVHVQPASDYIGEESPYKGVGKPGDDSDYQDPESPHTEEWKSDDDNVVYLGDSEDEWNATE